MMRRARTYAVAGLHPVIELRPNAEEARSAPWPVPAHEQSRLSYCRRRCCSRSGVGTTSRTSAIFSSLPRALAGPRIRTPFISPT